MSAKMRSPKPTMIAALNDKKDFEPAIFLATSELFWILPRSATSAFASRITANCETIARIPVTAATAIARYRDALLAPTNVPCAAGTKNRYEY